MEKQFRIHAAVWVHENRKMTPQAGVFACQSWGEHILQLKLPTSDVKLTGLSVSQKNALKQAYPRFAITMGRDISKDGITCRACRLDHPPAVSPDDLTRDGLYTPRIIRRHISGIEVTGINFEARIGLGAGHTETSLGVVQEDELPRANVIENFLRIFSAYQALAVHGVMLHSAGLVFNNQAYIFSGRSNAGKTTLTRKAYEKGAWVLSDDINLVLPGKDGYQAHAVPFSGEFGRTLDHRGGKDAYPVAGIILLEQGDQLGTEPVRPSRAAARLLTGCPFVNMDARESERLFDAVTRLVARVPVIRLTSRRDDDMDEIINKIQTEFGYGKQPK